MRARGGNHAWQTTEQGPPHPPGCQQSGSPGASQMLGRGPQGVFLEAGLQDVTSCLWTRSLNLYFPWRDGETLPPAGLSCYLHPCRYHRTGRSLASVTLWTHRGWSESTCLPHGHCSQGFAEQSKRLVYKHTCRIFRVSRLSHPVRESLFRCPNS